ncbi:thiopurine S-methyltransferase [Azorhizophilus paspali]|uniref:Thiopurine S-methyltransferase n=1 Tax=Azorhizophilus paspali TaxID=69963 RepID=A0ABV6SKV6_AZOPA
MHEDFWQARWARDEIGFHQAQVNPYLSRHWPTLGLAPGSRVLVPLCGKSLDLAWLAGQGFAVLGVELAEKAVQDFFDEQQLIPQVDWQGAFRVYRVGSLEIRCGDFFALSAADVGDCRGFYDRAALIALPAKMRERCAAHLSAILPSGCRGLLVCFDYDQTRMGGPPFAVDDHEVRRLLEADWQVRLLEALDVLGENWRFLQRGLDRLEERVYRLERR